MPRRLPPVLVLLALTLSCGVGRPASTPAPTATPNFAAWPVVLRDFFFEPANDWEFAEDSDGRFATGTLSVADGKYRFDVQAKEGFVWWSRALNETATTDFYAAVDGRLVSGSGDTDYGLIFRYHRGNYYYFQVSDVGQYALYLYNAEEWQALIPWTASDAIQAGQVNRVAVAAEGGRFQLYLNGLHLGEAQDETLPAGAVGVAIQVYNAGERAVFEFDNFEWRAPASAVSRSTPAPAP